MPLYIFTKSCPQKLYFELGAKQKKKKMRKGRKRERKEEGGREKERGEGGDGGTEKDAASQPLDTTPTSQPSLFLCCRNLGFPSLYFRDVKVYFFEKL